MLSTNLKLFPNFPLLILLPELYQYHVQLKTETVVGFWKYTVIDIIKLDSRSCSKLLSTSRQ